MSRCVRCDLRTYERCVECGDAYCGGHDSVLCPMCTRIRMFKFEQAERRRVVWWQYVEPVGAVTEPMPTVRMEALPHRSV
jgi:hypothetical protein